MSASLLLSLALTVGQGSNIQPPLGQPLEGRIVTPFQPWVMPPVWTPLLPNYTTPYPYFPNYYPYVPQPVIMAHPDWYPHPGPVHWYRNEITPYHVVVHAPLPLKPKDEKKKKS